MRIGQVVGAVAMAVKMFVTPVFADGYPESLINRHLQEAKETVDVNLSQLKPGQRLIIEYIDYPVFIYRRTEADLNELEDNVMKRADPDGETHQVSIDKMYTYSGARVLSQILSITPPDITHQAYRSLSEEYFVAVSFGPVERCMLRFVDNDKQTPTVFFDPCSGVRYDTAGRALSNANKAESEVARFSLYIPPHSFPGNSLLKLGLGPEDWPLPDPPEVRIHDQHLSPTQRLIQAANYNDLEAARAAINEGANANYFCLGEDSPFNAAIIGGSMELLNLIVEAGGRPTPNSLEVAKIMDRKDAIELIKELGDSSISRNALNPP
ncbi:hypothetical protein [Vreelandella zhaodongensis]|uniref:Ankyrin repeat domain-containing protein n=1 Tax=Vreelandella zhaodongensis TaxID=1176240 RepID=A0ABX2STA6_VREZH|nr:hypothetical protein [Halomonas zhaodongensis]NYS45336.1 hypothetical protein [Halomonas zhaodongensis]